MEHKFGIFNTVEELNRAAPGEKDPIKEPQAAGVERILNHG